MTAVLIPAPRVATVRTVSDWAAVHASAIVLTVGIGLSAAIRLTYVLGSKPVMWFDSRRDIFVANHSLFSKALWAGAEPPLVPLMWKMTGSPTAFTLLQTLFAIAAWGFLAWTVWASLDGGWRGAISASAVVGFSLSPYVVQWDTSVLSESISLSALAVIFASGIWLAQRFTWMRAAGVLLAAAAFAAARDEGVLTVGMLGLGIVLVGIVLAVRRRPVAALRAFILAVVCLVCAGSFELAATSSHRNVANVEHSLYVRVFPYRSQVAWFAAHGMPESHQIDTVAAAVEAARTSPYAYAAPKRPAAMVVGIVTDSPYWAPLVQWMRSNGPTVYAEFVVTHPGYDVTAPFKSPALAFNSPTSLSFYGLTAPPVGGWIGDLFFPRSAVVWGAALIAAVALDARKMWRCKGSVFLAGAVVLGALMMLTGWLGDGEEVARHMIEGNVVVRLATLLLVLAALLGRRPGGSIGLADDLHRGEVAELAEDTLVFNAEGVGALR